MASSLLLAEKTDKVVLKNGNEIIGEIKKLDRGKLENFDSRSPVNGAVTYDFAIETTINWKFR
jgi:hypothetical protein